MKIKIIDEFDIWGGDHHIDFKPGVSVLVGPNGAGKSTTLLSIKEFCKTNDYRIISYDNLHDGGDTYSGMLGFRGEMSELASFMCSSEGQRIIQAFGNTLTKIGREVRLTCQDETCDILFVLLDAVDSGLSIDNIRQIKDVFELIQEDCKKSNIHVYIVVCANSYEFTVGQDCVDVKTGQHIWFEDYTNYANFICEKAKNA